MTVLADDRHVGLAVEGDRLAAECFHEKRPLGEVDDPRALDVSRVVVHDDSLAAPSDRTSFDMRRAPTMVPDFGERASR